MLARKLGRHGAHIRPARKALVLLTQRACGILGGRRLRHEIDYNLDTAFELLRLPTVVLGALVEVYVTVLDAVLVQEIERALLIDRVRVGEQIVNFRRAQHERVHELAFERGKPARVGHAVFQRVLEYGTKQCGGRRHAVDIELLVLVALVRKRDGRNFKRAANALRGILSVKLVH